MTKQHRTETLRQKHQQLWRQELIRMGTAPQTAEQLTSAPPQTARPAAPPQNKDLETDTDDVRWLIISAQQALDQ